MKLLAVALPLALMPLVGCSDDDPDEPDPEPVVVPDDPEPEPEPEPEPDPEPTYADELIAGQLTITTEGGVAITSKEDYVDCTISLTHQNEEWNLTDLPAGIRGRGNSSWLYWPKKPYRIKFDKKQPVLGLGKAKSWVLLSEYRDPTDLMNAFVFELGQLLGLPYTNHNRYVRLTLNGKDVGLYHLTEQVQQGDNRVAVDEQQGYLLSLDKDDGPELAPDETDNFWSEVYDMPVCVKNPDEPSATVLDKARADLAILETAIKGGDYAEICSMLEISTMIDYLIVQELVYNVELDAPRSMYIHKDIDKKWAMGPLWDFDAGFDFNWGDNWETGHHYFDDYRELVMGTQPANHVGTIYWVPGFFSDLFRISEFVKAYKARWTEVKPLVATAWDNTVRYYEANADLWAAEATAWPIDRKYANEINKLNTWLTNRAAYLDTIIKNYAE